MLLAVALVVGGGIIGFAATQKKTTTTPSPQPTVYKTQQECETATGRSCHFSMCDYKCAAYYKGWIPTIDKVGPQ